MIARAVGTQPMHDDALVQRIRLLPKVELHLHLEGSVRRTTVQELAAQHEPQSPLAQPGWYERYWTFTDLAGFLSEMRQVALTCLREPEDYYRLAAECFADLWAQRVRYAEVMFGPRPRDGPHHIPFTAQVAAIEQARQEAEADCPLRLGLVVSLNRTRPEMALPVVREAIRARERWARIVGIDLVGDETAANFEALAPAYRLAAEAGLGLAAHAGESAGPASCWGALRVLGARRLGHAARAAADKSLVEYLRSEQVTLTMCPTSNVRTSAVTALAEHPIRSFHQRGLAVTVNSDDPIAFGATILDEYVLLARELGFTLEDLRQLTLNAVNGAFLPSDERAVLRTEVERTWRATLAGN